ncbi:MAG: TylF/MycF family methyltransferase [Verrucomicrobiae bacterium]|nr:TylF/MycF family methyltransferase [Verrucomicrobiae bacterium]
MKIKPEDAYLDLMKKALTFSLWPEPPVPIDTFKYGGSPIKRLILWFLSHISRILRPTPIQLVKQRTFTKEQRDEGWGWPGYAHSMIGLKRFDNIRYCVETVIRDGIEGDLIETGVWRGGACIFMRAILAAHGVENRKVYLADSFEGLPRPNAERFPADKGDTHHIHNFLKVSQAEVENNFRSFGLLDDQVVFLKGWFSDTLPKAPMTKLAVLRLDGDMYGSTMDALKNLYPKLSKGGFCIIDDYHIAGCKKAVEDFRAENGIRAELIAINKNDAAVYWRKE